MKLSLVTLLTAVLALAVGQTLARAAESGSQADNGKAAGIAAPAAPAPAEQPADAAPTLAPAEIETSAPATPWKLPEPEFLKELGIEQYGWLEQGATFNSLSPVNRWNGPVLPTTAATSTR